MMMFPGYVRMLAPLDGAQVFAQRVLWSIPAVLLMVLLSRQWPVLRDSFRRLGRQIRSCHAKDIHLEQTLTTHLNEVRPGLGHLDYHVYLEELSLLEPDVCLMIEHLPNEEEYLQAADHIRKVAAEIGASFV